MVTQICPQGIVSSNDQGTICIFSDAEAAVRQQKRKLEPGLFAFRIIYGKGWVYIQLVYGCTEN